MPADNHNLIYIDEPILESAQSLLKNHGGLEKAIGLYDVCENEHSGQGGDNRSFTYFTAIRLYLIAEDGLSFVFPQISLKEFLDNELLQIPETRKYYIRLFKKIQVKQLKFDKKQVHQKKGIRNHKENIDIVGKFINDYYGRQLGVEFKGGAPSDITWGEVLAGNFY